MVLLFKRGGRHLAHDASTLRDLAPSAPLPPLRAHTTVHEMIGVALLLGCFGTLGLLKAIRLLQ